MSAEESEFVTIGEAARRLGISERQAQRYVRRLSDVDRHKTDTGRSLVRLSALSKMRGVSVVSDAEATHDRHDNDTRPTHDGHVTDAEKDARDALIEQLRGENARLWDALTREQETARAALSELSEARKRSDVLIAAAAQGRLSAPPMADTSDAGRIYPQEATGSPKSEGSAPVGESDRMGGSTDEEEGETPPPRSWWQRLWKIQ